MISYTSWKNRTAWPLCITAVVQLDCEVTPQNGPKMCPGSSFLLWQKNVICAERIPKSRTDRERVKTLVATQAIPVWLCGIEVENYAVQYQLPELSAHATTALWSAGTFSIALRTHETRVRTSQKCPTHKKSHLRGHALRRPTRARSGLVILCPTADPEAHHRATLPTLVLGCCVCSSPWCVGLVIRDGVFRVKAKNGCRAPESTDCRPFFTLYTKTQHRGVCSQYTEPRHIRMLQRKNVSSSIRSCLQNYLKPGPLVENGVCQNDPCKKSTRLAGK